MGKIPKGLSDKAMFQGYEEEPTLEECFLAHEACEEEKHRSILREKKDALFNTALTPALLEILGKELLQLKLDLFAQGVKSYRLDIKRTGDRIILSPVENKGR